jgi:hypothetical protein
MQRVSSLIVTAVASAVAGAVLSDLFDPSAQAPVAEASPSPSRSATATAPARLVGLESSLSGRVIDGRGRPVEGAVVVALTAEPVEVATAMIDPGRDGVISDDRGRFHIAQLRPGRYVLIAIHGHHSPGCSGPVVVTGRRLGLAVEVMLGTEAMPA